MVFVSRVTGVAAGRNTGSTPAAPAVVCTHSRALASGGCGVSLSTGR